MRSYPEVYLLDAMEGLGEMCDFVACDLAMDLDEFWDLFIVSGLADAFGRGAPQLVAGMSGAELALAVMGRVGMPADAGRSAQSGAAPSAAYWSGYSLAYFQWLSGLSLKRIHESITFATLARAYPALHEASEDRFAEEAWRMVMQNGESALKRQRLRAGLSQSQLARRSGVGLRAIQQYEQGAKQIDRAAAGNVEALSLALSCSTEDILELRPTAEYAFVRL